VRLVLLQRHVGQVRQLIRKILLVDSNALGFLQTEGRAHLIRQLLGSLVALHILEELLQGVLLLVANC